MALFCVSRASHVSETVHVLPPCAPFAGVRYFPLTVNIRIKGIRTERRAHTHALLHFLSSKYVLVYFFFLCFDMRAHYRIWQNPTVRGLIQLDSSAEMLPHVLLCKPQPS